MAVYKYAQYLQHSPNAVFDATHHPGAAVPYSGIYRCVNCDKPIAANQGDPLPPQNHHQHPGRQPILWQLIVATH